jgi:hypothetical protein
MPAAMAVIADTVCLMMMIKIVAAELSGSLIEVMGLFLAQGMIMPTSLCLH